VSRFSFQVIYLDYLRLSLLLSSPGTVIIGDNVVRKGRVGDLDNRDPDVVGVRKFFELAASDSRLDSTAMQTVGSKGWDGFSITVVSA
jgi:predicted O-methyltransferase YrrM